MWWKVDKPRMVFHARCDHTAIAVNQSESLRRTPSARATTVVAGSRPIADGLARRCLGTPRRHVPQLGEATQCAAGARSIRETIR